jgi:hypothetical protein
MHGRGETKQGNPMIDHEFPLTLNLGAILRIGVLVSIIWIIGDAIDGGSQSFIGVPLLVAAWLGAFVALDRWVSGHVDQNYRDGGANAQQPDFSKVEMKTTDLGNRTYMLEGQGGKTPSTRPLRRASGAAPAERAVADGEIRRDLEATLLDVDEEFAPALRALSHPGLEADEFLPALGSGADQHKHASAAPMSFI